MTDTLKEIIDWLPNLNEEVRVSKDLILANAVMFGEIPSPTCEESKRVRFMQDRFIEAGCQSVSTDEMDNAFGIIPGDPDCDSHILLSAHLDTPFSAAVDHTVRVEPDGMIGPGILDNSLGLAVIATLPFILEKLNIKLRHNLLLMGSSRSLGLGDIEGIRFFLDNNNLPIHSGIIVEGGTLGRLSYKTLGMMRGVISCTLPDNYDPFKFGAFGTIPVLNQIITRMLGIPLPKVPATNILYGSMDAGTSFNTVAKRAQMRFEIRSEAKGMVTQVVDQIQEICDEISASSGLIVKFETVANRSNGGLDYSHPMVRCARRIIDALEVQANPSASTGELAALVERGIPGLTIGMTDGSRRHQFDEKIKIEPLFSGLAQLIALIKALDEGICDVEN